MARIEFGRHKKVNAAADDGVSEVQPQHWNDDSHAQIGILGFDSVTKTLVSGAYVMSDTFAIIAAETGTTDDLDTITTTDVSANDLAIIKADTGDTITVKHATGNIILPGSKDIVLLATQNNYLILVFDGTNWRLPKVLGNSIVDDNGNELIDLTKVASAVNQIEVKNAIASSPPEINAVGGDTNIDLLVAGKGTGRVRALNIKITTVYDTNNNELLKFVTTASAVNEPQITNAATGNNPIIEPTGGDANIGFNIPVKGTGRHVIGDSSIDIGGILGLPQAIITISTGALAGTKSAIAVAAESGTADILDTLTGLSNDDIVVLYADAGDTITVNHDAGGADAIHLRHKIDIELSEDVPLILVRRGTEWYEIAGPEITKIVLAIGKPADALATGNLQVDFPMDMPGILLKVKANVSTVSSSELPTFQIQKDDGSPADVLSTALTIDANEKTSETAATPAVIDSAQRTFAADDRILIDVDVAGTGTLGAVVTLWFVNKSDE